MKRWYSDPAELRARHKPALSQLHSETSNQAARQIERYRPSLKATVYNAIAAAGGLTDEAGIEATGMSPSTYRPRRVELVEAGLIRDSHRTALTRSRRKAVVWIVT